MWFILYSYLFLSATYMGCAMFTKGYSHGFSFICDLNAGVPAAIYGSIIGFITGPIFITAYIIPLLLYLLFNIIIGPVYIIVYIITLLIYLLLNIIISLENFIIHNEPSK